MSQYLNEDLEYVADGYFGDMVGFDDENGDGVESDFEDADSGKQKDDTSASEFRNGKDIQAIQWERLNYSRDKYRELRLKQYKNYENFFRPRQGMEKDYKKVEKGNAYYDFQFNTRLAKSTVVHFQEFKKKGGITPRAAGALEDPNDKMFYAFTSLPQRHKYLWACFDHKGGYLTIFWKTILLGHLPVIAHCSLPSHSGFTSLNMLMLAT